MVTDTEEIPHAEGITLIENEEVLHNVRPSWAKWAGLVLISIPLMVIGVGFLTLGYVWLKRKNTRYIVTNQRLIHKTGLLGSSTTEYRITNLRQLQTGATWGEKSRGHGNIQFTTGSGTITFDGIADYETVANTIRERQRELEG